MCCLFGLHDYSGYFNHRQKNIISSVLSTECEARGTDATGIAYNANGGLRIFKKAIPAHNMVYHIPKGVKTVMGHTRMTTQGSEAKNYNNHPFYGTAGATTFALAHNVILQNDTSLKKSHKLPNTKVQTDSYVAVQLIEKEKSLTFESLGKMAELVRGSFCFTVLDDMDNLYFIKGDNPLCIYHFVNRGFYFYASTKDIADKALKRLGLDKQKHEEIPNRCGNIIKIDSGGGLSALRFDTTGIYSSYQGYFRPYSYSFLEMEREQPFVNEHLEVIKEMASAFGYTSEDVEELFLEGFSLDEIENFFYEGEIEEVFESNPGEGFRDYLGSLDKG